MMRVLNCFTRRGLLIQAVWCTPAADRHRATVLVEAAPITIDQIVRELESTVGVECVERLDKSHADQLARLHSLEFSAAEDGSTVIKIPGPPEENRFLLTWFGS